MDEELRRGKHQVHLQNDGKKKGHPKNQREAEQEALRKKGVAACMSRIMKGTFDKFFETKLGTSSLSIFVILYMYH